ncbi:MAG TPA: amidohydrolase family protein [Acidimicrobiales bacterium]|nr:amidohydrolase family protein [Acidimicrobiales bacterium]
MYDLIVRNGTIVDGTGAPANVGDIGVKDGRIAHVGGRIDAEAVEVIDAAGRIVTPGFVDIHTHYDGQVTWDPLLEPSTLHGVTTLVMGNCGVGFAPVRPGSEAWLIQLMEGVEDIPGAALAEGMQWEWESFGEYLDVLDRKPLSIDIATQVPHAAVRAYVMGERGASNEAATADDIAAMRDIVRDAIEAGALGFSTSRTLAHRAKDGVPVPGTFADEAELFGIADALRDAGAGIYELVPLGAVGEDLDAPMREVDLMARLAAHTRLPVTFALTQVDNAPELWRDQMEASLRALEAGHRLHPQYASRPAGVLVGLHSALGFGGRPSYDELTHLPLAERVAELRTPARKQRILGERARSTSAFIDKMRSQFDRMYVLGDPVDYEPGPDMAIATMAEKEGVDLESKFYDLLLGDEGRALLLYPVLNYSHGNADATYEMMHHPAGILGLSDGGAHCGAICDASQPTWMLTHWVRDRVRGPRISLESAVRKQTSDTAELYGFRDRGTIAVGKKADLNVIDFERLRLLPPRLVHDLPAQGRRLIQAADGYVATIVSGVVVRRNGVDTGARPGALVRGQA